MGAGCISSSVDQIEAADVLKALVADGFPITVAVSANLQADVKF